MMGRKAMMWLAAIVVVVALAFLLGPRAPVDTAVRFDPAAIGPDPAAYLEKSEASVAGIRDGHAKEIVWADPAAPAKTPLAVVYIHGYSASKFEIRPVPDRVAEALGANLYFTRLMGHGRDGAAMATATVQDWIDDFAEAMAIGRMLGERVVVMATSTGGGIATYGASQPELADGIAGMVLISPNYEPKAPGASILTMPWGGMIAELVAGKERSFEPDNEAHGRYWTTRYPTSATLPMAAVTKLARDTRVEDIAIPALFIISDKDQVVSPERTRAMAARWGAPHRIVVVNDSADSSSHVLAGDALSPGTTDAAVSTIVDWLRALP